MNRHTIARRATTVLRRPRVILLLVLVSAFLAWLLWSTYFAPPTDRQYQDAAAATKDTTSSLARLDTTSSALIQSIVASLRYTPDSSSLSDDTATVRAQFDTAIDEYEDVSSKLVAMPIRKDSELRDLLNSYERQVEQGIATLTKLNSDYPAVYRAYTDCKPVTASVQPDAASFASASKPCLTSLQPVKNAKTQKLVEFAKELEQNIRNKQSLYQQRQGSSASMASVDNAIARTDLIGTIQRLRNEALSTKNLDAIESVISTKLQDS